MMKLVSFLAVAGVAAASSSSVSNPISSTRILSGDDGDGGDGGNGNAANLQGYFIKYSTCMHTKIKSDDDDSEGNTYYVNGAYRAQYNLYASFHLCTDSGNGSCECDKTFEYATDMDQFLQSSINYVGANGGDETAYLECTYGGAENGVSYYLGPQCSDTGSLVIGTYYDEDCTVKASFSTPSFSYNTFSAIESTCQDCSTGTCDEAYEEARKCYNGKDMNGDDDEGVCSAVKRATAEVDYSKVKKRNSGAILFAKVFISMLVIGLICGGMFLAYTYYLRHRGDRAENLVEQVPAGAALT